MLTLDAVSKRFGQTEVLHDLSLTVAAGEVVSLIGPSGCGKSTVLRLMLGLARPDGGAVWFDGAPVDSAHVTDVRRRTGYVIQDGGLFPHLTARDNVRLRARTLGWSVERMAQRLAVLCDLTTFPADALDRYPVELSGGQRQRVALMRGLMLDPDVLLLDEPLGALDPMIRFALQDDLRAIFARLAKTVVVVTHDLAEAAFFGHRVVLMRAGRIEQAGPLGALIEDPASTFVTEFVTAQRGRVVGGGA